MADLLIINNKGFNVRGGSGESTEPLGRSGKGALRISLSRDKSPEAKKDFKLLGSEIALKGRFISWWKES